MQQQLTLLTPDRLIGRLRRLGVLCADDSADSVRRAMLDAGVQCLTYGRTAQIRCATFADAFEAIFKEPLVAERF